MSTKAIRTWQKIFDWHATALKMSGELSVGELKLHLKIMLELIGLRWAMHTSEPKKFERSLFSPRDFVRDEPVQREPMHLPREGGEESPWWDRKTRFAEFNDYAKSAILRAAFDQHLKSQLDKESSDQVFYMALVKMVGMKVSLKKVVKVGVEAGEERSFAASVLFILDSGGDLKSYDTRSGGLSHLLAQLEKSLKLI